MAVRADYDPSYFQRFLWMAIGCAAAGAWFLFDGAVAYPRELDRCKAFWQSTDNPQEPWEPIDDDQWWEIAKTNGWSSEKPDVKPDEQEDKIGTQFFYGIASTLLAIPFLLKWYLARGTWIEGDENGITSSRGQSFQFEQVESINKQKWEDKGIAKVRYREDGSVRRFVIDDFKFQREPMDRIIRWMEAKLTDDQIIGGTRQPELKPAADVADDPTPEDSVAPEHGDDER
jgi:hypothetical protein